MMFGRHEVRLARSDGSEAAIIKNSPEKIILPSIILRNTLLQSGLRVAR